MRHLDNQNGFCILQMIIGPLRSPLMASTCSVKSWYVHQAYLIKFAKTYKYIRIRRPFLTQVGAALIKWKNGENLKNYFSKKKNYRRLTQACLLTCFAKLKQILCSTNVRFSKIFFMKKRIFFAKLKEFTAKLKGFVA